MITSIQDIARHIVRAGKSMVWFEFDSREDAETALNLIKKQYSDLHNLHKASVNSGNVNKHKFGFGLTHTQFKSITKFNENSQISATGLKVQASISQTNQKQSPEALDKSTNRLVISTQSLDQKNIALENPNTADLSMNHSNLEKVGNGHTALAIASVLNSPLVVLRSEQNQEKILKTVGKIDNNSLVFITGHCSIGSNSLGGLYFSDSKESMINVSRTPDEIVHFLASAGLKRGDSITIVLCVCYGAKEGEYLQHQSFASRLAISLAEIGVSSTIYASKGITTRFGKEAIVNGAITFNSGLGIKPNELVVFETMIRDSLSTIKTSQRELKAAISISAEGLQIKHPETSPSSNNSLVGFFKPSMTIDSNPQSGNWAQKNDLK
ncbi:TPA: hypothetical protein L6E33_002069 [Legionella pneumophila]|nr:hypothetical protein [Legionella pneumophila]HBP6855530.1 hypothetical protein [Legionella pneumophila]HBP6881543.1 hypothetical protein [Legionella pneumophila]HBP6886540.1 hypothetical protein [Legionella pneumophila]HBP6889586.1 hypothetical protein [Legionella pneumophila]